MEYTHTATHVMLEYEGGIVIQTDRDSVAHKDKNDNLITLEHDINVGNAN